MASRSRRLIERMLPWFDPMIERRRDARTERIARKSEAARAQSERIIEEYRQAARAANLAGDRLVNEARRDR